MATSGLLGWDWKRPACSQVKVENAATQAFGRTREFRPDVILLDVCMPGADGGDVAFQIHDDPLAFDTNYFPHITCLRAGSG